ncbi:MAG: response regulator transcription factor [Thermodesulfobacteriota bacterium]
MSDKDLILIVDDEDHIRETVCFALDKAGFRTVQAADGQEALRLFQESRPALIVLDILMPELDGTEVCRLIRQTSSTPIIFLTSKDEEIDRVVGLELGGDDYVSKPFSPRELAARVRAVLRRGREAAPAQAPQPARVLRHGLLKLDLDRHRAWLGEQEVILTATEFGLLRTLMGYPGKVYTRDELMDGAYADQNYVSDRTIDSHVRHIRKKMESDGAKVVETVHGLGYRLGPCRIEED